MPSQNKKNATVISVRIPKSLELQIIQLATIKGETSSDAIRHALAEYVANEQSKHPQSNLFEPS